MGKTTCASAFAVARAAAGDSVLLLSTDPAHSLGDALGVRLGARPKAIRTGLQALELDAPRAFARWMDDNRAAAGDVLEHGTWLDRANIDALLELPIPGVDELVGLIELDRAACAAAYSLVVVDTAPTGHTLRLLAAPDAVRAVAAVLDALQEEHRLIRRQLAGVNRPEAADRLIEEIAAQAAAIAGRLRDQGQTTFRWVTLPESLSLAESEDALAALDRAGIRVPEIVINRVLTDEGPCPLCDRRRAGERAVIQRIRRTIGKARAVRLIPAQSAEPCGLRPLAALARYLAEGSWRVARGRTSISPQATAASHGRCDLAAIEAIRGARLIFVGGKGGVGKTTVAAAVAVALAESDRRRRVLLLSTDPAHSLGDVFGAALSDAQSPVPRGPANLLTREIDAAAALAARRQGIETALNEIAASLGAGRAAVGGGAAELMDLAPPGIDELFGMLSVFDARADFDVIVVDTAPTGHALRLLELPETARAWVQALLRVLFEHRALVPPGQLASELVDVSKSIRALQAMLHDPASTRFLVVTRAARLPRLETERLLAHLARLRLAVPAIVINALTLAPGRCRRCRTTHAAERREVSALRRAARRRVIIRTPLAAPAPRGARALQSWARRWLV